MTENGTDKVNTKSVGYSSGSSDLVTVSFSTIVKVGASCREETSKMYPLFYYIIIFIKRYKTL